jgi:hypothetical protein
MTATVATMAEWSSSRMPGFARGAAIVRALADLENGGETYENTPESPVNAESEAVKVDSAAILGRDRATLARVAKRFEIPPPGRKSGPAYPPHVMRVEQVATHFSMSRSMWLSLVKEGKMPPGFTIPGTTMRFWNTAECEDRFDDLANGNGEPEPGNTMHKILGI